MYAFQAFEVSITSQAWGDFFAGMMTVSARSLGLSDLFEIEPGVEIIVPFLFSSGRTHNVKLRASRDGKTFYGEVPAGEQVPQLRSINPKTHLPGTGPYKATVVGKIRFVK